MGKRDDDEERGARILDLSAASQPQILTSADILPKTLELYDAGMPPGASTGWESVDPYYTVAQGYMTILTGWPGSGKSELLDALCVNLAEMLGWKIMFHSPENLPRQTHISKLLEKFARKPFGAGPTARMTRTEVVDWSGDIAPMFQFIESPTEEGMSVAQVMRAATMLMERMIPASKVALVLDPWNEMEHMRPSNVSETEYISQTLSRIRNWSRKWNAHTFIVAHPQKIRHERGERELPVPRPDMISGSQHWWNKADNCLTVWRDFNVDSSEVMLYVQKVRFKHMGRIGVAKLIYDRPTGRYADELHTPFNVKGSRH